MDAGKKQLQLSPNIFWDVDPNSIDYDKDRLYIMDRVLNYGLWNDFTALVKYYGKDCLKSEIVRSPYLKKDVLNFLCFFLDLQPTDFKCYTRRQSQPQPWTY